MPYCGSVLKNIVYAFPWQAKPLHLLTQLFGRLSKKYKKILIGTCPLLKLDPQTCIVIEIGQLLSFFLFVIQCNLALAQAHASKYHLHQVSSIDNDLKVSNFRHKLIKLIDIKSSQLRMLIQFWHVYLVSIGGWNKLYLHEPKTLNLGFSL